MRQLRKEGRHCGFGALLLISLCIGLLLAAGTLSATHAHSDGASHADCGLCSIAHVDMIAAASDVLVTLPQVFEKISFNLPPAPHCELVRFELFTRPPPANASRS